MAEMRTPKFVKTLQSALADKFAGCTFDVERVTGTNRYRLAVVWDGFAKSNVYKRQDQAWQIAEKVLDAGQLLRISMILTLRPDELSVSGLVNGRGRTKASRAQH
jgi:hypothetical protein